MTTYAPIRIDLAGFARDGLGDHAALITLAQQADRLGFGGIWFNEFHFARDRLPHLSTLLLGAAILAVTERLSFGTSILMLPLLYSPEPNEQRQFAPYCAALDRHGQGTAPLQASSLSRNVCIHKDRATALAQLDSQTRHLNDGRAARARAAGNPAQRMDHIAPWKVAAPCVDRQRPGPVGGGGGAVQGGQHVAAILWQAILRLHVGCRRETAMRKLPACWCFGGNRGVQPHQRKAECGGRTGECWRVYISLYNPY